MSRVMRCFNFLTPLSISSGNSDQGNRDIMYCCYLFQSPLKRTHRAVAIIFSDNNFRLRHIAANSERQLLAVDSTGRRNRLSIIRVP